MAVQGPITRSAPDLELALSILAGPDIGEDVAWRLELPAPRRERLADFRVGVLPAIPWITLDDRIASTLEDLATRLDKLGCTVKRVQPDGLGDWKEHYLLYRTLLTMMTTPRLPPERRQLYLTWYRKYDSEFSRAAARGLEAPPSEYLLWIAQRERYRAAWRAFFREWDVLLAPAFNTLAYPHVDAGAGWLIFKLPPAELALHPAQGAEGHEFYFMCDDIDATMQELTAKGG